MRPQQLIRASMVVLLLAGSFVSMIVAAPPPGDRTASGSGSVVDPGERDCATSPGQCSVTIAGTLQAPGVGSGDFSVRFNVLWSSVVAQGIVGRECAPASGVLIFTSADGSTVTLSQAGRVCRSPDGVEPSPMKFDGNFVVIKGTAALTGVQGAGEVRLSVDKQGNANIRMQGTFRQLSGPVVRTEGH